MAAATAIFQYIFLLILVYQFDQSYGQQSYLNNKQFDCNVNWSTAMGFKCNGAAKSCRSYLTFRATSTYNSPVTIAYLLDTDATEIARINNVSDVGRIPSGTLIIVPVNCSCSGEFYQHNASYVLKGTVETYYAVANETYQGLTTCQSLQAQNSYNFRNLKVNMKLNIPVRCACPTKNQTASGFKYLLAYLITWGDSFEAIASMFNADVQSIYAANELSPNHLIHPFNPLLIPYKSEPTYINTSLLSFHLPPSPPQLPVVPAPPTSNNSSRKWVFIGVGIGVGVLLLLLVGFLVWFLRYRHRKGTSLAETKDHGDNNFASESVDVYRALPESESKSWSEGVKFAIESLTMYKYEELQHATGSFAEANRIRGSVYRGNFKGDYAAVKMIKGEALEEINVLKQISHSNIIRLSGFCLHDGNTYLVYEYAEKGGLSDLLHSQNKESDSYGLLEKEGYSSSCTLNWKQRVQIAYDVADAVNYLHNYANPPYIHKNLKSSNILLDGNMRAKVSNFSLARPLNADNQNEGSLNVQMTRHVIGTHGYMPPEYIENGLVTPKLDVFAIGVVILELLSGREAIRHQGEVGKLGEEELLYATINKVLDGENVREKLQDFMDPQFRNEYPLDLAHSVAQLARNCVAYDLNTRPPMAEVFVTLSKILSSSLDWDPSDELERSRSLDHAR
ncbi:protein LYK5 [Coffea arabica]|uniref:Protein LYK5 n=1 Tax=Coffea arabica TaxID=13443 RepID=A0A6P6UQV4_COFAR|nr:protein LYK5-like [Coffea arabica]